MEIFPQVNKQTLRVFFNNIQTLFTSLHASLFLLFRRAVELIMVDYKCNVLYEYLWSCTIENGKLCITTNELTYHLWNVSRVIQDFTS